MELKGARVIVTGGASGMGAQCARRLAEAGAAVAVGDVDAVGIERVVADAAGGALSGDALSGDALSGRAGRVVGRRLDVSDPADCDAFVAWAADALGGLDALINNAGIIRDGLLVKVDRGSGEVVRLPTEAVRAVHAVNLEGPVWMTRAFAELRARALSGDAAARTDAVIVNLSSVARFGNRGQTSYVASKAAMAANAVTWARELAPFGVRVVAVAPGMIETPMTQGMNQRARDALVARIPVGRIGEPEDIWQAVRFAMTCTYFNARCVDVDGGLVM
jgi:3-oxoacyl-[acyl-carrier protein] reductase